MVRVMKRWTLVQLSLVCLLACLVQGTASANPPRCKDDRCAIDIHRAIRIADPTLKSDAPIPYELDIVAAKRFDEPWNDLYPESRSSEKEVQAVTKELEGRVYWMIYYRPRGLVLGGDKAVFIDAMTGDVLWVYRGK